MKARSGQTGHQLSSSELQQLKWLLGGVLTLVSIATVFYLDVAAWLLMAVTAAAVVAVTIWPWLPGRVPRWVHRLAFPAIVAAFTADLWLNGELLPAGVRLDILLLLYRTITYRQKRDDLQLIVLGLFLIIVAGVLTVSLTFAVHILAFTACALAMLLVVTLAEASAGFKSAVLPPRTTPNWAVHAIAWRQLMGKVRQVTDWRVVTLGIALFTGLVVLSGLLFIAIPRFQLENGLFLERFVTKKTRTGFSDTIRFGDVTDIAQDNSVALSVDVSDHRQIPAAPYWRMLVLDEYRDGIFRLSPGVRRASVAREQRGLHVRGTRPRRGAATATWVFYLESGVSRYLPLLGSFEDLRFQEPRTFHMLRGLEVVALRDEPATMLAYRVEGMQIEPGLKDLEFGEELAAANVRSSTNGALMLGLPLENDDRATLARINAEFSGSTLDSAGEYARKASTWLGLHHAYSLQPKTPPGAGDPLIRWLNSGEAGHCELFAGSFAMLARSAGFPARVVTGFRGGSWNAYSNNFTLRNSDAHAWCELFDAKTSTWIRVDPTPGLGNAAESGGARGEAAIARRNDRSWKARLESLRVFWYRQIVNFDQQSQLETINSVKQATEESSRRVRLALEHWRQSLKGWVATPWSGGRLIELLTVVGSTVIGLLIFHQLYQRFKFRFGRAPRGRPGDLVRIEAGRWLKKFASAQGDSEENPLVATLRADLQRIRFGQRETWPEVMSTFRRARKVWRLERRRRFRERI